MLSHVFSLIANMQTEGKNVYILTFNNRWTLSHPFRILGKCAYFQS